MYRIPTTANLAARWPDKFILGDWTWTLHSNCRTIVAYSRQRLWPSTGPHNGVPFSCILIFSDSQAAIKSLSNIAHNSGIVKKMPLLSQPFFWAIQCHTYLGSRTSGILQSGRASQGWCTFSWILFNRLGNATYMLGFLGNATATSIFFLGNWVSHLSGCSDIVTFRETTGWMI